MNLTGDGEMVLSHPGFPQARVYPYGRDEEKKQIPGAHAHQGTSGTKMWWWIELQRFWRLGGKTNIIQSPSGE